MRTVILFVLIGVALFASDLSIEHNFNKALDKAKIENKDVMMMYSATWCPECNYMKDVVFHDKKVSAYIQNHYIVLVLDIQKDKLPSGFSYEGIPTFFFFNAEEKEKKKLVGGSKATSFLKDLKARE